LQITNSMGRRRNGCDGPLKIFRFEREQRGKATRGGHSGATLPRVERDFQENRDDKGSALGEHGLSTPATPQDALELVVV